LPIARPLLEPLYSQVKSFDCVKEVYIQGLSKVI